MGEQAAKPNSSPNASVDLRSQLAIVRRYWWFTALVLIVALGATFILTQRQERVYSSSATVLLRTNATVALFPFSNTGPRELMRSSESEQLFVQSPAFTSTAQAQSPAGVSVSAQASGNEIRFTARGTEPADVAAAATTWAELYVVEQYVAFKTRLFDDMQFLQDEIARLRAEREVIRRDVAIIEDLLSSPADSDQFTRLLSQKVSLETLLQPQLAPIDQQIASLNSQLSPMELITRFLEDPLASARLERAAGVPSTPVSPNVTRNLAVGGLLGLALGIGAPYARHALNDKIEDEDDVEGTTQLPILGTIPTFAQSSDSAIEVLDRPTSFSAARYQTVLTAIEFAGVAEPISSVLFTSAVPGEGKTTTAVNIAALASKYMNVVLIDADMRRPKVHEYTGVSNRVGLAEILAGDADFFETRHLFERAGTRFDVLTAGRPVEDPALLLRGSAWPKLLSELFLYDLIIVDGPPVLAVTDALLIGQAVDGQILLSRSGATKREDLADATTLLATNRSRSLGVVMNQERASGSKYSYYNSYAMQS